MESIAQNTCRDGLDNNCDGEVDYDGDAAPVWPLTTHGDMSCPVDATGVSAEDPYCWNVTRFVPVNCTFTTRGRMGNVTLTDRLGTTNSCNVFAGWIGASSTAMFNCSMAGMVSGPAVVSCGINGAYSYNTTPAVSFGEQLNALNQPCPIGICSRAGICIDKVPWDATVLDDLTGTIIPGQVNITIDDTTVYVNLPNPFSLTVPVGNHKIWASMAGYDPRT